jgi:hypothetical protein
VRRMRFSNEDRRDILGVDSLVVVRDARDNVICESESAEDSYGPLNLQVARASMPDGASSVANLLVWTAVEGP